VENTIVTPGGAVVYNIHSTREVEQPVYCILWFNCDTSIA